MTAETRSALKLSFQVFSDKTGGLLLSGSIRILNKQNYKELLVLCYCLFTHTHCTIQNIFCFQQALPATNPQNMSSASVPTPLPAGYHLTRSRCWARLNSLINLYEYHVRSCPLSAVYLTYTMHFFPETGFVFVVRRMEGKIST